MLKSPRYHILIVDDDESSLKLLELFLRTAGYRIAKAENGAQALEMLQQERYDLIITDVGMPRIGGLRILEEVKKRYGIPAMVVTATDADSETQRKAYALGARKYMLKPLDREELLQAVGSILGKDVA